MWDVVYVKLLEAKPYTQIDREKRRKEKERETEDKLS